MAHQQLAGIERIGDDDGCSVVDAAPVPARLVVIIDATGVRVEGVDVETVVQLIARLR